jgi:ketosteroid isomerase-like protein
VRDSPNVELVRSILAAWERGDFGSLEWAHPGIDYVIADGPAPGRWTGLAGMAEGSRGYLSAWRDYGVEAKEYRDIDSERVLVLTRHRGRGKTSGVDLEHVAANGASLFCIRDGKVTRLAFYWDSDRALADLGLAPD